MQKRALGPEDIAANFEGRISLTIRHAVELLRRIVGMRYLCVHALCIIQDGVVPCCVESNTELV